MNKDKEYNYSRAYYLKEGRTWQFILNELRTENIRLKNQLSEAISHEVSPTFVERAEQFQQQFIEKDQVMDLLRHDINTMLYKVSDYTGTDAEERQYTLLEKDIEKLIYEFHQMKISFSGFLTK